MHADSVSKSESASGIGHRMLKRNTTPDCDTESDADSVFAAALSGSHQQASGSVGGSMTVPVNA
jgi:hypothetical protein